MRTYFRFTTNFRLKLYLFSLSENKLLLILYLLHCIIILVFHPLNIYQLVLRIFPSVDQRLVSLLQAVKSLVLFRRLPHSSEGMSRDSYLGQAAPVYCSSF